MKVVVPSRAPRHWRVFVFFVGVDVLVFAFTWHSHVTYVARPGMPTVMPVGQLLGWAAVVILTLSLLLAAWSSLRTRRLPSYRGVRIPPRAE